MLFYFVRSVGALFHVMPGAMFLFVLLIFDGSLMSFACLSVLLFPVIYNLRVPGPFLNICMMFVCLFLIYFFLLLVGLFLVSA